MPATDSLKRGIGYDFDGDAENFPRMKIQRTKFKNDNDEEYHGFSNFFRAQDPRKRARVEADYTVTDDEDAEPDPLGFEPGDDVEMESEQDYKRAKRVHAKADGAYFDEQAACYQGGAAEEVVNEMEQEGNRSGKELELRVDARYEKKSDQHISHLYCEWLTKNREPNQPASKFIKEWNDTRRTIEANMKWEQMRIHLLLKRLGPQFEPFHDLTIANSRDGNLDLNDVAKRAVDWGRAKDTEGEAKPTQIALSATGDDTANESCNHRGPDWTVVPCSLCNDEFHCRAECFKKGGGLAHFDSKQRNAWIRMKQEARGYKPPNRGHSNRNYRRDDDKGQAMMAGAVLEGKHQKTMQKIHGRLKEHGLEDDFTEFFDN